LFAIGVLGFFRRPMPSTARSMNDRGSVSLQPGRLSRASSALEPIVDMPVAFSWCTGRLGWKCLQNKQHVDDTSDESDDSSSCEGEYTEDEEQSQGDVRTTCLYIAFCLGVQMFMSYDSGATSSSLDTIQDAGLNLTQTQIGVLGSIDKVGQTLFSMVWGRALQLVPTKRLMACSLLANAVFSLTFGVVFNKWAMFAAKFSQGATEALQGIWGTVWTLTNAPPSARSQWMGMGAIAAGLGNGLGTVISGFATANGAPYSVAFIFQSVVLGLFWIGLLTTPGWRLSLPGSPDRAELEEDTDAPEQKVSSKSGVESSKSAQDISSYDQAKALLQNKLYVFMACNVAQIFFFNSGVQYIWTRLFVEGPWRLNKNWVVTGFLMVTGVGSFLGVAIGPRLVDAAGGYADDEGKYKTLKLLLKFAAVASLGSGLAIAYTAVHLFIASDNALEGITDTPYLLWSIMMFIFLAQNATVATHTAICCESVPSEMQSFATGMTVAVQNLFGYASGAFLPGVVMDQAYSLWKHVGDGNELSLRAQLGVGFMFACASPFMLMVTVALAAREVRLLMMATE